RRRLPRSPLHFGQQHSLPPSPPLLFFYFRSFTSHCTRPPPPPFPNSVLCSGGSRPSSTPASTLLIRPSPHSSALPLALREEKPRPADVPPSPFPSRKSSSADKSESISATPTTPARRPAASSGERAKTSAPSLPPTPSRSGGRRARAR
ncbi:unnamed protein product, partial [Ixodes persulcatus]